MMKNKLKILALCVFMTGFAGVAQAEFKPGFKVAAYIGQFTPADEKAKAHLESVHEANLSLKGSEGPLEGYFEIESRNTDQFKNTQRRLDYKLENLKISVGTVSPKEADGFAAKGGTKTSQTKSIGAYEGLLAKTEADGLGIRYKITDGISAGLILYSVDALNKNVDGTATQAGLLGKFGPIGLKVSGASSSTDSWDGSDPAKTSSNSNLGLQYKMEGISFSVDVASKKVTTAKTTLSSTSSNMVADLTTGAVTTTETTATADVPEKTAETGDTALQVKIAAGPGKAVITYAARAIKDSNTETWINLVYDIKLDKNVGMQVAYLSMSDKPDGAGDTTTENSIAGGFYGKF